MEPNRGSDFQTFGKRGRTPHPQRNEREATRLENRRQRVPRPVVSYFTRSLQLPREETARADTAPAGNDA